MKKIFLFTFLIFACLACKKSEDASPVKEFIIGKWQLIAQGPTGRTLEPVTPSGYYTEYFRDGTMGYYGQIGTDDIGYIKYIDRSCRMEAGYLYIEFTGNSENNEIYEWGYEDEFNWLRLTLIQGPALEIVDYPRIKEYQRIK